MTLLDEIRRTRHLIWHRRPHQADTLVLQASELSMYYENALALKEISFELKVGERMAVVGPNGAGKSTLFKIIAGVLIPTEGQVHIYGLEPGGHICIAYLPQRSQVDWDFPVNVADVVMMGRIGKLRLFRHPQIKDWNIVQKALEVVGLSEFSKRQIGELSGGQQQKMFIARALAQEAELMLMDEPLSGLDVTSQDEIFSILDELQQRNVTVMVALHDLNLASRHFDRVMLLNHHLFGVGKPAEVFTPEKLVGAFGGHIHFVSDGEEVLAVSDTCCNDMERHP
ncbi:MAG: metal ABC transporter ATP-binding protein [Chloroflexota bacterium]